MLISQIKSDIDFLCGSTSGTYTDTNKVRNINLAYQRVASLIWESQGGWHYDDSNATTLAIATTTLVASQQDYELPSTAQRVNRVDVLNADGDFVRLRLLDERDVSTSLDEFMPTPGMPLYYRMMGRSVLLYPAPDATSVTLSAGLQVYVDRDVTEFTVTATSTVPGFPLAFHRILSYAAAIDFTQDPKQVQNLLLMKDRLEKGLTRFYAKRLGEGRTNIKPHSQRTWRRLV